MIIFHKKTLFFLIFFLVLFPELQSQANNAEAAFYNIGVGAVFSGIGAVINKEPEGKFGKILLKRMAQGALGGYLVYESKILVGKIAKHEKLEYGWPAKFINSAGISIIENAASNRDFWEQWNLNIGFNRIEFHTKDNFKIKYKIMPAALLLTGYSAFKNKFEWNMSAKSGEFIFSGKSHYNSHSTSYDGTAVGTSIILDPEFLSSYGLITHEIIHIYQYFDFNVFNTYVNRPLQEFEEGSDFFKKANKLFHYDFNFPLQMGIYMAEHFKVDISTKAGYYKNFFEQEAYYYSH